MRANSLCAQLEAPPWAFCTSGTALTSKAAPWVIPSRASICAAFASASFSCASVSIDDTRTSSAPAETCVPRSTGARRRGRRFGGDVGLLLGHQRAGGADEARDRLLDGGAARHATRRRRRCPWPWRRRRCTRRGERRGDEQAASEVTVPRFMTTPRVTKPERRRRFVSIGQSMPAATAA
jgi:hypothetical protein